MRSANHHDGLVTKQSPWRIRVPTGDYFPSGLPIATFLDELGHFRPGSVQHDDMVDVFTMAVILVCVRDYAGKRTVRSTGFSFGS